MPESEHQEFSRETLASETEQEIMLRAKQYWEQRLRNETRIEAPMNPACQYSIVVPVHGETINRLKTQIESLQNRQDIKPEDFEIIYVINNDISDGTERSRRIFQANQDILQFLRQDHGLNIYVIDKSSLGNEIPDCNVGRARNRGLAESSKRFFENNKNGLIIQTDADTYFEDPDYFTKLSELAANLDVIGIAGGLTFEWSPDSQDPGELEHLRQKVERLIQIKVIEVLANFLRNGVSQMSDTTFSGAHMISRSLESASVGGFIDAASGEDPKFGQDLMNLANGNGQKIIGARGNLRLVTALRDSDRTEASFKKIFDRIDLARPELTPNILAEKLPEFRERVNAAFQKAYELKNEHALRELMTLPNGSLVMDEEALDELVNFMNDHTFPESQEFFNGFRMRHFGGQDSAQLLYAAYYPPVELNQVYLDQVMQEVEKRPGGKQLVENLIRAIEPIRLSVQSGD